MIRRPLGLISSAILGLTLSTGTGAQAPSPEPSYVVRGHQTEARQKAFKERLERFYAALSKELQRGAPDLLASLERPPVIVSGYQLLPRIVPDPPPAPPVKPVVISYSWKWSDTLMTQESTTLQGLEADLAKVPPAPAVASHATYEAIFGGYKKVVDHRRLIEADIDYNWLWQGEIFRNRPGFDALTTLLDAAAKQPASAEPSPADGPPLAQFSPPGFVRIDQLADHDWLFTVTMYTDISDVSFVQQFKTAVETAWHVRTPTDEFRLSLDLKVILPARLYCASPGGAGALIAGCHPPGIGDQIDLPSHLARFPKDGAVLTTGAASLKITWPVIFLGPHDVTARALAHESGHLMGFPDVYLRGYRDLGADGFQVLELVPDSTDIMSSPGTGQVSARHFEALIASRSTQTQMQAGLDAFYQHHDPIEAVARFREVLAHNPAHYGATFQLAKALDEAGKRDEARLVWTNVLTMAEAAKDAETTRVARARLADGY